MRTCCSSIAGPSMKCRSRLRATDPGVGPLRRPARMVRGSDLDRPQNTANAAGTLECGRALSRSSRRMDQSAAIAAVKGEAFVRMRTELLMQQLSDGYCHCSGARFVQLVLPRLLGAKVGAGFLGTAPISCATDSS